jgi:hypothetical protein
MLFMACSAVFPRDGKNPFRLCDCFAVWVWLLSIINIGCRSAKPISYRLIAEFDLLDPDPCSKYE